MASGAWEWGGTESWTAGRMVFSSYSNGSSANSSTVTVTLYGRRVDGGRSHNAYASNFWVSINGSTTYRTSGCEVKGSSWTQVHSYTTTVYHDSNGSKTIYIEAGGYINGTTFNIKQYGVYVALDNIPRYANITGFSCSSTAQGSAKFSWSADASCSRTQYKLGSGDWTTIANSSSSGSFTLSNLAPNTSYSIQLWVERADSKLGTYSGTISFKTLDVTTPTNANMLFDISEDFSVSLKNTYTASTIECDVQSEDGSSYTNIITANIAANATAYLLKLSEKVSQLYNNCKSKKTVNVRVTLKTTVSGKSYSKQLNGTGTVINSEPTFSAYNFGDSETKTQTVLKNTSYICTGIGNMQAKIPVANKAVLKNSASGGIYYAEIKDASKTVVAYYQKEYSSSAEVVFDFGNSFKDGTHTINIYFQDSRGFNSGVVSKTFTVLKYHKPNTSILLERLNKFEREITLDFKSTYSRVLIAGVEKNVKFDVKYRSKEAGSSVWTAFTSLAGISKANSGTDDKVATLVKGSPNFFATLDSAKTYNYEFIITDSFDSYQFNATVQQGIPIMIEGDNGTVGIGMIPDWESSSLLQVASDITAIDNTGIKIPILATLKKLETDTNGDITELTNQIQQLNTNLETLNNKLVTMNSDLSIVGNKLSHNSYTASQFKFNTFYTVSDFYCVRIDKMVYMSCKVYVKPGTTLLTNYLYSFNSSGFPSEIRPIGTFYLNCFMCNPSYGNSVQVSCMIETNGLIKYSTPEAYDYFMLSGHWIAK